MTRPRLRPSLHLDNPAPHRYSFQLNFYSHVLEKYYSREKGDIPFAGDMGGGRFKQFKVTGKYLVVIHPSQLDYEMHECLDKRDEVAAMEQYYLASMCAGGN